MHAEDFDVVVVGAGNAAFSAAHAAAEGGSTVCMLEKAPEAELGGNSYFTLGSFRITYGGMEDVLPLLSGTSERDVDDVELSPYPAEAFLSDLRRLTNGRTDPVLSEILVTESYAAVRWLRDVGIEWRLQDDNQTFIVDGKRRFWGGGTIQTVNGGKGLIAQHRVAAARSRIDLRTEHRLTALEVDNRGKVIGAICDTPEGVKRFHGQVVLACGGFEADARLRAMYLGRNWETAKVRGTRHNTGDGLEAADKVGAQAYGNWSGAHAVQWDPNAPTFGDRVLTNQLQRHSYPYGILVNGAGRRFADEGSDFRNYTYAKLGSAVLDQPGGMAFQIFDDKSRPLLRSEYSHEGITRYEAGSIRELAELLELNPDNLERTVDAYNASTSGGKFDPTILDGCGTRGLEPPKSNWARPIDQPPFLGFPVVCAITFTYGGLRIDSEARVLDQMDQPISGLHAAGEMVGGLFYENYPGGSGLVSGAVFGRRAGTTASAAARRRGLAESG